MSEFKTLKEFADHVDNWYKNQLNVITHFTEVPENVLMEVDGEENTLSGDMHKGFVIGMRLVLQDMQDHPPFVVLDDNPA